MHIAIMYTAIIISFTQGFDYHIMNDHYMFDYVYFKFHSDKVIKDPKGIPNAMEWYINKMV